MTSTVPVVGVCPADALKTHGRLFESLELACGVRFAASGEAGMHVDGVIATREDRLGATAAEWTPTIAFAGPSDNHRIEDVTIAAGDLVERELRGIVLPGQLITTALEPKPGEEILAHGQGGAVWTRSPRGLDRLGMTFPVLGELEVLRALLGPDDRHRVLSLVALVSFLREIARDRWTPPPRRATFIFDDPNLRRTSYGHLDYRTLVEHADRHGYHTSMAMVPLDATRVSPVAAEIFRRHSDRLSLSIHGNDHTRHELLRTGDPQAGRALAAQALKRVQRFEQETDLRVDRVMVPPHGMCSGAVVEALAAFGYDGLCAPHAIPWTERPPVGLPLAGWTPATFVGACSVIPRMPFGVPASEIAMRAFLHQPLVLYGHHDDVADGYDLLAEAADRVNGFGPVEWCSLGQVLRGHYQLSVVDGTARIRAWSSAIDVTLPAGVETLTVELPAQLRGVAHGIEEWTVAGAPDSRRGFDDRASTAGESELSVRLLPAEILDPSVGPCPRPRMRPWVRRRATEIRDRIAPMTRRVRSG